jgi:hypothetical protein
MDESLWASWKQSPYGEQGIPPLPGFKGYQQPWQDSRTTNAPVVGLGNPGIEVATGGANDETICGTVGAHWLGKFCKCWIYHCCCPTTLTPDRTDAFPPFLSVVLLANACAQILMLSSLDKLHRLPSHFSTARHDVGFSMFCFPTL